MPNRSVELASVGDRRRHLDQIDDDIIALLRHRQAISLGIQQARVDTGGDRIDAVRESAVVERYRTAFAEVGGELAAVVLRICRGDVAP